MADIDGKDLTKDDSPALSDGFMYFKDSDGEFTRMSSLQDFFKYFGIDIQSIAGGMVVESIAAATTGSQNPFSVRYETTGTPVSGLNVEVILSISDGTDSADIAKIVGEYLDFFGASWDDEPSSGISFQVKDFSNSWTTVLSLYGESEGGSSFAQPVALSSRVNLGSPSELTISSGSITVLKSYHTVDTESDAATDDLDSISGGNEGDIVRLFAENSSRTVVLKDGTGNLRLTSDCSLASDTDNITLVFRNSVWCETSRSINS